MKMMSPATHARFGRICRALRAEGVRLGFLEMSKAAELALLVEEDEQEAAADLAVQLGINLESLG